MTRNNNIGLALFMLLLISIGETSCMKKEVTLPAPDPSIQSLGSLLKNNYSFGLFNYALQKTGLNQLLTTGSRQYTLLVCDNDAFGRDSIFNQGDLDKLDTAYLRQWMSYHILPGTITSASIPQAVNNAYNSITGQPVYFSRPVPGQGQKQTNITSILHINGDTVATLDLTATDGVIQVMRKPLTLPSASVQAYLSAHARYSLFVTGLQHFALWDQLTGPGPFTIWAPDNDAFANAGISADSVSRLDTVRFKSALFQIYVLSPARVFQTDFIDIGGGYFGSGVYFSPNNGPYYTESSGSTQILLDYYNQVQNYPAPWTDPDNIAGNGVVQGIGGLLYRPDQQQNN